MRQQLEQLRAIMKKESVTAWLSPCSDAHGSEYIGKRDECTKFLTGFTGDSCTVLVLPEEAYLWTDGRYFVQAEAELRDSGVTLMRMGEKNVPTLEEFLLQNLGAKDTLAFCAGLFSAKKGSGFVSDMQKNSVAIRTDIDLVNAIWTDRPKRSCSPVWVHELTYAGSAASLKIESVREKMRQVGCNVFLSSALDETAWLTNLRASDIECNPVFLSYVMITENDCRLFLQKEAADERVTAHCAENGITVCAYDDWTEEIKMLSGHRILTDLSMLDFGTFESIRSMNEITDEMSPIADLKSRKSPAETEHMKESHIRDGVYVTKFMARLGKEVRKAEEEGRTFTETDASDILDGLRRTDERYVSLSFPTISAYGPNAAMCHYMAQKETASPLHTRGLYLVDSGAQYLDGTTDITRTMALGETTEEERRDYTLTVIGMLKLLNAVFPEGTLGISLDVLAREALWSEGLDFNHGTGHGVGYLNNVHEMPVSIRCRPNADPRRDLPFAPGMVTSDEPGYYAGGRFGIRVENMILCRQDPEKEGCLSFVSLTCAPIDPAPLEVSLMSARDIAYYNRYQKEVCEKISPFLTAEEADWLKEITKEITV